MSTRIRLLVESLFTTAVLVATAAADPPTPPPPANEPAQTDGGTFVPDGGYVGTVRRAQAKRQNEASRVIQGAPPRGCLQGTHALPVICVSFKNVPPPFPASDYQKLLFGGGGESKTMTQYYDDMSDGKLHVTGTVLGWYQLPKDDTFYENDNQGNCAPFGELLQYVLEKADAEIDFGLFDNDGEDGVSNSGDDDGKVDTLVIIHSDCGGECGNADWHIRSRSGHYSDPQYGHLGKPFVTRAIRHAKDGNPKLGPDGKPEHIVIEDFIILPGIDCPRPSEPPRIIQIGSFCHEYGHALGLPDLYARTTKSLGAGNWCLMAYGCYGGDPRHEHAETPVSMSAWCKQYLGWANVQPVRSSGEIQLEAVEDRNTIYRIDVPNTNDKEYFLIEYRNNSWKALNRSRINWDCYLPGSGLAIWHIDERVGAQVLAPSPVSNPCADESVNAQLSTASLAPNPNWPFAPPNQGQNDAPTLPNGGNTGYLKDHSLVALVEADGQLKLARGSNYAAEGDLWTTDKDFGDDPTFLRGSRAYDGRQTGIALKAINLAAYKALVQNSTAISPPPQIVSSSSAQPSPADSGEQRTAAAGEPSVESLPSSAPAVTGENHRRPAPRDAAPPISRNKEETVTSSQPQATSSASSTPATLENRLLATTSVEPTRAKSLLNLNHVLNQTGVTLNDIRPNADKKRLATNLNEQLEKQGFNKISAEDLAKIAKAQPAEIHKEIEPNNRPLVQALGTESRTKELDSTAKPSNRAESDVVKLLQEAKQKQPVQIQSTPEGTRIARVTDLSLPAKTPDIAADARARVTQGLKEVIGEGVKLQPKENPISESPQGGVVRFEQVVQSNGKSLPVFETETALYYSETPERKLTTITNETVSTDVLKVTGAAGKLSVKDAKAIVANKLKVDAQQLRDGSEGVYLVGHNPKNARVAVMVSVPVDEHHDDIKVFVDSDTKEILEIK